MPVWYLQIIFKVKKQKFNAQTFENWILVYPETKIIYIKAVFIIYK